MGMGQTFNWAAVKHCREYEVLGLTADDVIFRTHAWDHRFHDALEPHRFAGVVYGNDLVKAEGLCTHPFFGSIIPQTLGRILPPEQRHLYIDNNFMEIGKWLKCRIYLEDVVTEHEHFSVKPEFVDDSYLHTNSDEMFSNDYKVHRNWVDTTLIGDMKKVRQAAGLE